MAIQYEIQNYRNRVTAALEKLRSTQNPGDISGTGTKTEVLIASRAEIESIIAAGYTPRQIAEALKADVFGILPKTITQLFVAENRPKKARKKRDSRRKPGIQQIGEPESDE